jgi:D-alanyl-D-alanine carboxypeptidase
VAGTRGVTERLQVLLDELVARKGIQHAVMAVEDGAGSFCWAGAGGQARPDGAAMRPDTPFHIASVDKMVTAVVVLRLWEQGLIDLDASIVNYLPAALIRGLHRLDGVDRTEAITPRHLLGHTSGLADCYEDRPRRGRSLMERLFREGDQAWTIGDLMALVRDDLRPHFPPQTANAARPRVRYSDTNYQLLIAIVEAVRGEPVERVYDDLVFRPLDLARTWVAGRSEPREPAPAPAAIWLGDRPLEVPQALRSFPSVYSTCGDMLGFLRALIRGELFEDLATLSVMRREWKRLRIPRDAAALRAPGWPIEYGLGLMRFQPPRLVPFRKPVPAVVGHTGSTGSWLFHCPDLDLLLCGTVDQATGGAIPYRFVPRVLSLFAG